MHGQNDHLDCRKILARAGDRLQAIQPRHRDVHQHDVGQMSPNQFERLPTVAGFGDDLDGFSLFQQRANARAHEGMIIDEKDADRFHPAKWLKLNSKEKEAAL